MSPSVLRIFILLLGFATVAPRDEGRRGLRPSTSRWIASGEILSRERILSEDLLVDEYESSIPVSTVTDLAFKTEDRRRINYLVAASAHLRGYVEVTRGGLGSEVATIRYATESGEPDDLYIFIQSSKRDPVVLEDDVARNSRVAIVYDRMWNWTSSRRHTRSR